MARAPTTNVHLMSPKPQIDFAEARDQAEPSNLRSAPVWEMVDEDMKTSHVDNI
jgi:hypothetical protein